MRNYVLAWLCSSHSVRLGSQCCHDGHAAEPSAWRSHILSLICYYKTMHGMKWVSLGRLLGPALVICLVSPLINQAAEFVGLTTEIHMCDWDYQFFYDHNPQHD